MASKKQRQQIENINNELNALHEKADNELGVISSANSELLNSVHKLQTQFENVFRGNPIELEPVQDLSVGNGLVWSNNYLTNKGYDTSKIRLESLLTSSEIIAIEREINRPLVKSLKWDRWDYILTFCAGALGSTADFLWGDPSKGLSTYLSDQNTLVGGWFGKIHSLHHSGSPMDYQGFKMGGSNHRLRSIGHDLFGFLQGIWQIKNGTFTGGYFQEGQWHKIASEYNQYGTPYEKFTMVEAIWRYSVHVFCDFFSTKSLPIPGFGYLARIPIRKVRVLADEAYSKGYNMRHIFVQSLSIIVVELVIRIYAYLRYRELDLPKESFLLKQSEMRLMAHCLVTSFNVGKVVVTKNPLLLNLPQVLFTCYQFWPFIIDRYRRNNRIQIMVRNLEEIGSEAEARFLESISNFQSTKEFGNFLFQKPITL